MTPGGRLRAAIEVLGDVTSHHRPASAALGDWGRSSRYAGSGDRAAVGNLVFDALRRKSSAAHMMGADSPRALALGALRLVWGLQPAQIAQLCGEGKFDPAALSDAEFDALERGLPGDAPPHILADIPGWLWPSFHERFDDEAIGEGVALAARAPIDLRVNALKADRAKVAKALQRFSPISTAISPSGLRIVQPGGPGRTPNVQADGGFQKGWFDVQDEGSQIVSQLTYAQAGEQILDYCAGAGGKTLALAASMGNKGQIYAYDADRQRLAPIYERLKRAGVRNVQVREPRGGALEDLIGRMHRVVVDAPCTGTGAWRRRPDTKWRLTEDALTARMAQQAEILSNARNYVRPGGYLIYITCSVLAEENEQQVYRFVESNPDFELVSVEEAWRELYGLDAPAPWSMDDMTALMTPAATNTDGFFIAVLERR